MNKKLALGGIGTALGVLFLALSAYLPTGRAACLFIASLVSYIIACMADKKTAFIMFLATSVLSVFISPAGIASAVIVYIICFGNYPIIKHYLDIKPMFIALISKILCYTVYCIIVYLAFSYALNINIPYAPVALYFVGIFVFAFYDFLLSYAGKYALGILFKRF